MHRDPFLPTASATFNRRKFLQYIGAAGATALFVGCGPETEGPPSGPVSDLGAPPRGPAPTPLPESGPLPTTGPWVTADGRGLWRAPSYPVPLPGDASEISTDRERLARFEVVDDLVLPDGWRYDIVARWGDAFGANGHRVRFGFNNDYTGLHAIEGTDDEFFLMVNHEYVSARPWLAAHEAVYGATPPSYRLEIDSEEPLRFRAGVLSVDGHTFLGNEIDLDGNDWASAPAALRERLRDTSKRILSAVGISVLHVRRRPDGTFEPIADSPRHRRIHAYGRENVEGDHSRFTGPAAALFDSAPRGTMANCSGGTTPWGTFLTCEENFYNEVDEDVAPTGRLIDTRRRFYGARGDRSNGVYLFDNPTPPNIFGNGHLLDPPLDGREFGWVTEIDPETGHLHKHTALGRFRHENVTLRAETGRPLAAYMGDDRRGGHVWKFVSDGVVGDPTDPATSDLFAAGTLYVARFEPDFTGRWIPVEPETPLRAPEPEQCPTFHVQVPSRFVGGPVSVGDPERDRPDITVDAWRQIVSRFADKPFDQMTLGDLVTVDESLPAAEQRELRRGILRMDAFLMANACGGTPSARPEDLEVHPHDASVYIAFTDATGSSTGSPDLRIFPNSKRENSRQYGAIYRIVEDDVPGSLQSTGGQSGVRLGDPAATTFTWGKFVNSGEVAVQGGGFANADNMVFDPQAHLWMVTDISTSAQNFPTARVTIDGTNPGGANFPGVFGNNAMFLIPTRGPWAGQPQLFATAPMDAELCGPTFTDDGRTLILSVQHPGENGGVRRSANPQEVSTHIVHDRDDRPFEQRRTVPLGSNFPSGQLDEAPLPAVVAIVRTPAVATDDFTDRDPTDRDPTKPASA